MLGKIVEQQRYEQDDDEYIFGFQFNRGHCYLIPAKYYLLV